MEGMFSRNSSFHVQVEPVQHKETCSCLLTWPCCSGLSSSYNMLGLLYCRYKHMLSLSLSTPECWCMLSALWNDLPKTCAPWNDHTKTRTLNPQVSVFRSILGHHTLRAVKGSSPTEWLFALGTLLRGRVVDVGPTAQPRHVGNPGQYGKMCERALCDLCWVRHWGVTHLTDEIRVTRLSKRLGRPVIARRHKDNWLGKHIYVKTVCVHVSLHPT